MRVIINGEKKEFEREMSLFELMDRLKIVDKVMAVAVNMNIVKQEDWKSFSVSDEDKIEFLDFVGGG